MLAYFLGPPDLDAWWPAYPHDPSDFGRCLGLLEAVPEWRARISELAVLSPQWHAIVEAWEEIESLYRAEAVGGNWSAPDCYKAIKLALEEPDV